MKILIGCEESGVVRDAFLNRGHDAYSCDLLHRDHERHITGDIMDILDGGWDLIILHPPCTALAVSGNAHYGRGKAKYNERIESIAWTNLLFNRAKSFCNHVALENPVGVLPFKASQYIQPFDFGHKESKKTGLWLHNLPRLLPTNVVEKPECGYWDNQTPSGQNKLGPSSDRQRIRSQTYAGIAQAMADQWGNLC